jgi:hypothetical protein
MAMWGFIPMPSAVAAFIVTSCGSDGPAQSGSIRASLPFFGVTIFSTLEGVAFGR